MFDHVYSEPHPLMVEEKSWLASYEKALDENGAQA
jgi:2-oxoisovalerate dehydrogenase E1 component alpha subunit